MSESSLDPKENVRGAVPRFIRWDALAAIIAALVGLLALVVAGYTAYIQRQQVRAQVWPYLQMGSSNALGHFELVAVNKGVGPLIVRSVEVTANGKPVGNWEDLGRLFDFKPTGGHPVTSSLNGSVVSPGELVHWISFQNREDIETFWSDWQRFHVQARVCYASTLGDRWSVTFGPGQSRKPQTITACPVVPNDRRFHG